MTMFENGNLMCFCGGEMEPQFGSFRPTQTYKCICCGSVVDEFGVLHPSEDLELEIDEDTPISVVIPTIKEGVITIESIPDFWNYYIERGGNVSEARNIGTRKVDKGFIVFTDDDISFDYEVVKGIAINLGEREIAGIKGHSLGMLKSRLMVMRKEVFEDVGGFDEDMTWMEDTDFCIRAEKKGYTLKQLPRSLVEHKEHEKRDQSLGGSWHYYLVKKHGFSYLKKLVPAFFRKIGKVVGIVEAD